ncbi:hypothetical protein PORY_001271 [Pneumocystis oryctolagi]|uniref:Uncharacterized protein n=1 Tax=Pneumocystis oryctolagi TaxID=42067 RepID=A0ACB7CBH9_9ASCO|nr:hypothetical protein PORY_001271 [Pneumocystis oryctolagi]
MRLTLFLALLAYTSKTVAFQKYVSLSDNIFYSKNYESCSSHPLIEILSFQGKYYHRVPSMEFVMSVRSFVKDRVKITLSLATYGKTYINQTYDSCLFGISELCYLKAAPYFSTQGLLPLSLEQKDVPETVFEIPDFEGQAYFRFYSTITGNEIGCIKTTIANRQSFHQKFITWTSLGFFSLSAATSFMSVSSQSSFSYSLLAASHSIPGLLTFWNYFQFLASMAMENIIYPVPLVAWASNFSFSLGLVKFFQQLIYMFNRFTRKHIHLNLNNFGKEKIDNNNSISPDFYKGIQGQLDYLKIINANAFITSIICFSAFALAFIVITIIASFILRIIRRNEKFIRNNWINFSFWSILRLLVINVFGISFISIYQLILPDTYQPKVLAAFSLLIFVIPVLILSSLYLVRYYFRKLDPEMTAKYWGWLIVEYNFKRPHFYFVFFTYSLCKAIILGVFNFPSKAQAISLCAIELCYLLGIIVSYPFESIRTYVLELSLGIIRTSCLGTIAVFAFNISMLSRLLLGIMVITLSFMGKIDLADLTVNNIGVFRTLHQVLFPISYNEKFYEESLNIGELAKLAYFNDICVGCIRCQLEDEKLYLMTLGVLAAYRCLGVGQKLLDHILEHAQKLNIKSIYLHVWTENKDAIQWYTKRRFRILETLPNYYTKIQPGTAHVLSRNIVDE